MSIYLISFYQFKRSVMSNKDCYNRLLPQSVRKESAIRYVLNVHNYTSLQMVSYYQYRISRPPITDGGRHNFFFLVKKHNNCDKVLIWKPIYHTRMHSEENPNKSEQCRKALI